MKNIHLVENEDIGIYVEGPEGQAEIQKFIGTLRNNLGTKQLYQLACQCAEAEMGDFGPDSIRDALTTLRRFIMNCPPGHDPFHIYRDLLSALALVNSDPFVGTAAFESDVAASILGGMFHDIGNAVTHRYDDRKRMAGHAEIGAWLFFKSTEEIFPEGLRKIAAYAIAAHTHYLQPLKVEEPEGFVRMPYWYGIEQVEAGPFGFAPILSRFADRLDNNGVTHFCRHLLAQADALEQGGVDLSDGDFFEINHEAFSVLLLPEVRKGKVLPPTTLEHCRNYNLSNFGGGPYSKDDHLFRTMVELMWVKVSQTHRLIEEVKEEAMMPVSFPRDAIEGFLKETLLNISGSPHFDRSWQVLTKAIDELDDKTMHRWLNGFKYVQRAYFEWLDLLVERASVKEKYRTLAKEIWEEMQPK